MAPLKTYGSKKGNLLVKTGHVRKNSRQGPRRALATLQSANILSPRNQLEKNVVPSSSAKCIELNRNATVSSLKRPKKKLVKYVRNKNATVSSPSFPGSEELSSINSTDTTFNKLLQPNKNAALSSPSFPGSEELSSIWNADSTFDKLLQSNKNHQPALNKEVLNTSPLCKAAEKTDARKPVQTPTRCSLPSRSKVYKLRSLETLNRTKNRFLQSLTSPQCSGCSSKSSSCISLNGKSALQVTSTPNVSQNSTRPNAPECTPIYPNTVQPNGQSHSQPLDGTLQIPTQLSLVAEPELTPEKTNLTPKSIQAYAVCEDICSPDMFSSPANFSKQPHSERRSLENLSSQNSSDGGVVPQGTSGNSLMASCADDTPFPTSHISIETNSNVSKSSVRCSIENLSSQNSSDGGVVLQGTSGNSLVASCADDTPFPTSDISIETNSNVSKSYTSSINSDIDEEDCSSKNASKTTSLVEVNHSQLKPVTSSSVLECSASSSLRDSQTSKSSDDPTNYVERFEVAEGLLDYVNLRSRKVQWNVSSSLKDTSSRLEEQDLSIIDENISVEVEDAVAENPKTAPAPESDANLEKDLRRVVFAKPSKKSLHSAAIGRRTSIWMSSRSRAASRRFSVAPAKLLAQLRPESVSFRDLHGILAPPLAEPDNFNASLDETLENLTTMTIEATPIVLPDVTVQITARDVVLQKCKQDEPLPFEEVFPEEYLSKCRKIGEGLFGEVFMWENNGHSSVIKVIPIDGQQLVNGEPQKTFDEILSEIVITKELSDLRHRELAFSDSDNLTSGFVEVKRTACVYGKYPQLLLELWHEFADNSGTENDDPDELTDSQLFIVLELAHGGADLEKFVFNNSAQALSIFLQTAYALAAAEQRIQFEHRDLHWGNVLVSKTNAKHLDLVLDGNPRKIPTHGVQVSIIDFTLSRMTYDGCCIFNDLSQDDSLFVSEGDYQFDVYRIMRENCRNDWREFVPANNIVWLHYLVDKMISGVHYRKTTTKVHRDNLQKLCSFKKTLLDYSSTVEFAKSLV